MITNIVFDVGNVLVQFRPVEVMADLGMDGETCRQIAAATVQSPLWPELDRGVLPVTEVVDRMAAAAPEAYRADIIRFFAEGTADLVRPFPYAEPWLRGLKERGFKVFLLSNYPKEVFELHSRSHFPFLPYVDGKVVSGYVHLLKPDAAIYRCLLDTYSLRAEECVFIDDREENVAGAVQAGMRGICFTSYGDACARLDALAGGA